MAIYEKPLETYSLIYAITQSTMNKQIAWSHANLADDQAWIQFGDAWREDSTDGGIRARLAAPQLDFAFTKTTQVRLTLRFDKRFRPNAEQVSSGPTDNKLDLVGPLPVNIASIWYGTSRRPLLLNFDCTDWQLSFDIDLNIAEIDPRSQETPAVVRDQLTTFDPQLMSVNRLFLDFTKIRHLSLLPDASLISLPAWLDHAGNGEILSKVAIATSIEAKQMAGLDQSLFTLGYAVTNRANQQTATKQMTREQLETEFCTCSEARQHGVSTDHDFTVSLYWRYLGHGPDANLAYHSGRITSGQMTHAQLETEFHTCGEAQQHGMSTDHDFTVSLYWRYLGHGPDANLAYHTARLTESQDQTLFGPTSAVFSTKRYTDSAGNPLSDEGSRELTTLNFLLNTDDRPIEQRVETYGKFQYKNLVTQRGATIGKLIITAAEFERKFVARIWASLMQGLRGYTDPPYGGERRADKNIESKPGRGQPWTLDYDLYIRNSHGDVDSFFDRRNFTLERRNIAGGIELSGTGHIYLEMKFERYRDLGIFGESYEGKTWHSSESDVRFSALIKVDHSTGRLVITPGLASGRMFERFNEREDSSNTGLQSLYNSGGPAGRMKNMLDSTERSITDAASSALMRELDALRFSVLFPTPEEVRFGGLQLSADGDLEIDLKTSSHSKVHFFARGQYTRYDVASDRADPGYPRSITDNWPGLWADGITAAINGDNGKAYFFRGTEYMRYDITADRADPGFPRSIGEDWPGLWTDGITAAINLDSYWNRVYFFRGAEYMAYDMAACSADPGFPRSIAADWPGLWADGITAAINWGNGKAYFFRGTEYIRYDIVARKADPGYPKPINANNWPGLWTNGIMGAINCGSTKA